MVRRACFPVVMHFYSHLEMDAPTCGSTGRQLCDEKEAGVQLRLVQTLAAW